MRSDGRRAKTVCSLFAAATWASLLLARSSAVAGSPEAPIEVATAWIRWLPAGLPAAGYATLVNRGDKPMSLISASSPDYEDITLHRTVERGGTVSMVPVEKLTINPHSSLNFAAGAYHFMLMQPRKPLTPGDHVPITLRFLEGPSLTVQFEIRK
jgi:periplasmic copper chaperone A